MHVQVNSCGDNSYADPRSRLTFTVFAYRKPPANECTAQDTLTQYCDVIYEDQRIIPRQNANIPTRSGTESRASSGIRSVKTTSSNSHGNSKSKCYYSGSTVKFIQIKGERILPCVSNEIVTRYL